MSRLARWLLLGASLLGCGKIGGNELQGFKAEPDRLVPWQLETEGAPPLVVGIFDTAVGRTRSTRARSVFGLGPEVPWDDDALFDEVNGRAVGAP